MTSRLPCFTWYELATPDVNAAVAFYGAVVGWTAEQTTISDKPYTWLSAGDTPVAGVSEVDGSPPSWTGSILVDDLDATLKRARDAGAKLIYGPNDVPDMVRYAVLADPQGVVFAIHQALTDQPECTGEHMRPGTFGWSELNADTMESAFAFYSGLFGWSKSEDLDMGEMGIYRIFTAGNDPVGGMMTRTKDCPLAYWQFYINVDNINAAIERITSNGGKVLHGPHEVPGGAWIVIASDPQGVSFALVQPPGGA